MRYHRIQNIIIQAQGPAPVGPPGEEAGGGLEAAIPQDAGGLLELRHAVPQPRQGPRLLPVQVEGAGLGAHLQAPARHLQPAGLRRRGALLQPVEQPQQKALLVGEADQHGVLALEQPEEGEAGDVGVLLAPGGQVAGGGLEARHHQDGVDPPEALLGGLDGSLQPQHLEGGLAVEEETVALHLVLDGGQAGAHLDAPLQHAPVGGEAPLPQLPQHLPDELLLAWPLLRPQQLHGSVQPEEGVLGLALAQEAGGHVHAPVGEQLADGEVGPAGHLAVGEEPGHLHQLGQLQVHGTAQLPELQLSAAAGEGEGGGVPLAPRRGLDPIDGLQHLLPGRELGHGLGAQDHPEGLGGEEALLATLVHHGLVQGDAVLLQQPVHHPAALLEQQGRVEQLSDGGLAEVDLISGHQDWHLLAQHLGQLLHLLHHHVVLTGAQGVAPRPPPRHCPA